MIKWLLLAVLALGLAVHYSRSANAADHLPYQATPIPEVAPEPADEPGNALFARAAVLCGVPVYVVVSDGTYLVDGPADEIFMDPQASGFAGYVFSTAPAEMQRAVDITKAVADVLGVGCPTAL